MITLTIKRLSDPSKIVSMLLYRRTGWINTPQGMRFLIPGLNIPGVEISLTHPKTCYRIFDGADLKLGLEALGALIRSQNPEQTTIALTHLLLALLGRLVGWEDERCCLFIKGMTGSLKTSFVQVLMSIFGERFLSEDSLVKWGEGATSNAIMAMAAPATDLPFFIDNYKPNTGGGPKAFISTVHNILEGGEKDRLNKNAELRESRKISCWPICTGEDIPDTDAASLARSIILSFRWEAGKQNPELEKAQGLAKHLSAVGKLWLEYLEKLAQDLTQRAKLKNEFIQKRKDWMTKLSSSFPKMVTSARIASNLAINEVAWGVIQQVPELAAVLNGFSNDHAAGLMAAAAELADSTTSSNEAETFLASLQDLIGSEMIILPDIKKYNDSTGWPSMGKCHGWRNPDNSICIFLDPVLMEIARLRGSEIPVSNRTLLNQLRERGVIMSHDKDRATKTFCQNGETRRVLHLRPEAVGSELRTAPDPITPQRKAFAPLLLKQKSPQSPQITAAKNESVIVETLLNKGS